MKKIFTIAIAIIFSAALLACGAPKEEAPKVQESAASEATQEAPEATLEATDEPVATEPPAEPTASTDNKVIRVSTTTSVNDSGLLPYLQPDFEAETGYKLEITSNGTGAAIKLGETGDADCLLVHSKAAEEEFINAGFGLKRIPFMFNYFVIVGPKADPSGVKGAASVNDAMKAISSGKADFVSRGDDSGTHKAELKLWQGAKIDPAGQKWYISAGSGMGACLTQASERQAYLLSDKGTFLSMKDKLDLEILLEKGDELKNTYSLIAVNPDKNQGINAAGAQAFIDWMTSEQTLAKIAKYGEEQYGQALFYVDK